MLLPSLSLLSPDDNGVIITGMLLAIQQRKQQDYDRHHRRRRRHRFPVSVSGGIVIEATDEEAIQKLTDATFNLMLGIDELQPTDILGGRRITPMIYFCRIGDLSMILFLLLLGASTTRTCNLGIWFPMYAAASGGHPKVLQLLSEYDGGGGGDGRNAKDDINKENSYSLTPLSAAIIYNHLATAKDVLLKGGAQQLNEHAVAKLRLACIRNENTNYKSAGPDIINWIQDCILLHDNTFWLFLCSCCRPILTSSHHKSNTEASSSISSSLELLHDQPGIMELIGDYCGLIRGEELRMLKDFNTNIINIVPPRRVEMDLRNNNKIAIPVTITAMVVLFLSWWFCDYLEIFFL